MRKIVLTRGDVALVSDGYKGVSWHRGARKWVAQITVHGKPIYIGLFNTKKEAAIAYNEFAKEYFGEFAKLNEVSDDQNI